MQLLAAFGPFLPLPLSCCRLILAFFLAVFFWLFFNICAVCPKSRPTLLPLAVGAGKGNAAAAAVAAAA